MKRTKTANTTTEIKESPEEQKAQSSLPRSSSSQKLREQVSTATSDQQTPPTDVLIVHQSDQTQLFDLELARRREAERRLTLLGECAQRDVDKKKLCEHAQSRYLPERVLTAWRHAFHLNGIDGLLPQDWSPLSQRSQGKVVERLKQLGALKEQLDQGKEVLFDAINTLMCKQGWETPRKAERLVRRYQIDGIWGLAPERDPERYNRKRERLPPPELVAVSDEAIKTAERRHVLIAPYLSRKRIPNEELRTYAHEHRTSLEMMRKYLRDYRDHGLRGLLPSEQRSDKGSCHTISSRMEGVVAGIRFSQRDLPVHEVHTRAKQRALLLGEPEPTLWQVRQICSQIPEPVKEFADERYGEFRNKHRITYRYHFDGSVIVYQIDFTRVDVLLKDARRRSLRTKSEEVRAYLITCVECSSRLVMGYLFTYDVPTSVDIATVLHDALLVSENKPYGGIPDAVWVDGGKQLISNYMQQIARDLKFDLHEGKPNFPEDRGDPQKRGRVERPFGAFKTRLWSTLEGYTHSNTKERHPDVQGVLTISQLAEKFHAFIEKYHHEVHSETKQIPLEFWAQYCHPRLATPRDFAHLLPLVGQHAVSKGLIQYAGRRYWHDDLWDIDADAIIDIHAKPKYMHPDEVQVIYEGRWICPAFALDSEAGRKVDGKRVLTAQRRQRKAIQQTIDEKRTILRSADREIEEQQVQQDVFDDSLKEQQQQISHSTKPHILSKDSNKKRNPTPPPTFPTPPKHGATAWERALAAKQRYEQEQKRGRTQ